MLNKITQSRRFTPARLALGLLFAGLLWRTVRYFLGFPIWGDEALLAVNFTRFGYAELPFHLENCQVAPLLFLWGERAAWRWLGAGMLSMRLLPFAAGVGSLLLYWRLTRLMLAPRARLFAVGFLAVAIWPVSMSAFLKPYSFDLFMPLVLLVPAVEWLKNPARISRLAALTIATPIVLLSSYPSVFVAGAVSAALLVPVWRQGWKARLWFAAFNVALLGAFIFATRIGNAQLSASTANNLNTQIAMNYFWQDGFPPPTPWGFVWWLFMTLTGQMSAYPVGASFGGSIVTVALCVIGTWRWIRRGRWEWLVLMTGPIFLGLVAAIIHRYPFGASGRLSQHMAPGICILAGLGLGAVIGKARPAAQARKWTVIASCIFALIGLGGMALDIAHPYRSEGWKWMEAAMRTVLGEVPPGTPVVVCTPSNELDIVYTWYWTNGWKNVHWDSQLPPADPNETQLCGFYEGNAAGADRACKQLQDKLAARDPKWHLVKRNPLEYIPKRPKDVGERCELFFFARSL